MLRSYLIIRSSDSAFLASGVSWAFFTSWSWLLTYIPASIAGICLSRLSSRAYQGGIGAFIASNRCGRNWIGLVVGRVVCFSGLPLDQIRKGVSCMARSPSFLNRLCG